MKSLLITLIICIGLVSCNSGVGKKKDTTSGVKQDNQNSAAPAPGNTAVTAEPATQNPVAAQPGIKTPPGNQEKPAQGQPNISEKHQVVRLHPVRRDTNDPDKKMLNVFAKNKLNSMIIPLQKGDDPNLKASRDYYMNGSRKAKEGDNEGAIEDFTKSLALVKNATVYMRRGYCYLLIQDYQSALIDENEAIKMAPVLDKAYFARAICRFEMQDFKTAEEDIRKYMETDKTNPLAFNYLAAIKFMQKNFKEALDNYNEVARLDPVFPDVYVNRGMMRHNLGDLKGAIADYDLAIKHQPSNSSAYNNKGAAELNLKDYQAALKDFDMAIKLKEDYADAYDNRGKARIKLGDQTGACEDWNKAYSLGLQASQELIMKFCK